MLPATLLSILLAGCAGALALDPSLDVSQYAHTAWKVREGFTKDTIYSITQTPDGYLWLGTESGLLRFDGVRAVPWQPPNGEQYHGYRRSRDGSFTVFDGPPGNTFVLPLSINSPGPSQVCHESTQECSGNGS